MRYCAADPQIISALLTYTQLHITASPNVIASGATDPERKGRELGNELS